MAKLRPGKCTRKLKRPWTRQSRKKPRVGYVKGVPQSKVRRFRTGTIKEYESAFYLRGDSNLQIRDNALEAARIAITNYLGKNIKQNYYLVLRKYPFQVVREHKQAAVAGADRFFSGMRHAFGKPAGQAVVMKRGEILFELRADKKDEKVVREAFKRAIRKLPGSFNVEQVEK